MNECKFCKEPELEWFFEENTSKYKLGRKMDDNVYIPHECKKIKPNIIKKEKKPYPIRYVSTMVMDFCKKHKIELTELKRCSECGLDKQCYYATVENKLLKYPYRFTIKDGKEIKDYDITINDVIKNNLSN
tara:strand:+ start:37 stop:429 length:393 start_codon:yes stop_codon:yes gene_type:complete